VDLLTNRISCGAVTNHHDTSLQIAILLPSDKTISLMMECFYDGTTYLSCGANLRIEAPGPPQNNVLVAISALFLSLSFHLSQYQQGGAINPILVWRTMNGTVWELLRAIEDGEDFNRLIANDINSETLRTNL